ncbi:hypothetical protein [Rhizobacter sp. Root1221]|uniref:hypothetical protein n=1 Tax=Rhizobacter sp. Root1221 TaxID=1736433 RepID=UPI0012F721BF|nr:hypothetical protein [Rhizobacter sp. Root1221]
MSSWFRTALMWLLVAALPVQSWAAATMVNCGPSHHQMASESATHGAVPGPPASGHDSMKSHSGHSHEHHAEAGVSAADVDGSRTADTDYSLQKLGKFKCSACASCCLGVALPSPVLSFDARVSSDTIVAGMPQAVSVFLTDGQERPPRTILA